MAIVYNLLFFTTRCEVTVSQHGQNSKTAQTLIHLQSIPSKNEQIFPAIQYDSFCDGKWKKSTPMENYSLKNYNELQNDFTSTLTAVKMFW